MLTLNGKDDQLTFLFLQVRGIYMVILAFNWLTVLVYKGAERFMFVYVRQGSEIYADLNGWHLYLRDMKATSGGGTLAQVGPLLTSIALVYMIY
jgi:hypothetical protein